MTEQEIERCLERFATCKTTDVMNFDYAGTFAYIKRLKSENSSLRNEADENAALSMENKMRADRLEKENANLRERLSKAVELPFVPTDYHIEAWLAEIKVSLTDESATIVVPVYVYQKFDNEEAAFARLAELNGGKK